MEWVGVLILFGLFAVGLMAILPIAALIKASNVGGEVQVLRQDLQSLRTRVDTLTRLGIGGPLSAAPRPEPAPETTERINIREAVAQVAHPAPGEAPTALAGAPTLVGSGTVSEDLPELSEFNLNTAPPIAAPTLPPRAPQPQPATSAQEPNEPKKPFEFEQLLGANWLARLGIAAIALAAAFFLQYAFKVGWIGPKEQVGIGIGAALLMQVGAQLLIRKPRYRAYAEVLASGGVIVLFLSMYAAYNFYHLIPSALAMGVLLVAALGASALAVKDDCQAVAVICLLGAFATPALIKTPNGNPLNLYAYLAFLNLWALGLLRFKPWHELIILAFLSTWGLFFLSGPTDFPQAVQIQVFTTLFLALGVVGGLQATRDTRRGDEALIAGYLHVGLAAFVYGAASLYVLSGEFFLGLPAIMAAGLLVCMALLAVAVLAPPPGEKAVAAHRGLVWLAVGGLVLLTVAAFPQARPLPANEAPLAFAFIVFNYVLFMAAALVLRTSKPVRSLAPLLVGANALVHLMATHLVLGNVELSGIEATCLWPTAAGLIGLFAWWGVARNEENRSLALTFAGSAQALAILGMLTHVTSAEVPLHAAYVFGGGFLLVSGTWLWLRGSLERHFAQIGLAATLGNALAFFPLILQALGDRAFSGIALGAIATLAMAAYHLTLAMTVLRAREHESSASALLRLAHYGMAATFLAVALPLQLRNEWERAHLALAWSVEAAALVYAGVKVRDLRVRSWGYILLTIAALKSGLLDLPMLSPGPAFLPFLNERMLDGGAIVAASAYCAWLLSRNRDMLAEEERKAVVVLTLVANAFALLFGSIDLYDWTAKNWPSSPLGSAPQLALSLYWTVYAFGAAAVGIWRRNRPVRLSAVGLLYLATIKVFVFDLSGLETPYRIVSFLVLGLVLLAVSLLYTRFEERLTQSDAPTAVT